MCVRTNVTNPNLANIMTQNWYISIDLCLFLLYTHIQPVKLG